MKFNIFGRRKLEVIRSDEQWLAFDAGSNGVRRIADGIGIPASIEESQLEEYLADIFHEWATAEQNKVIRL